MRDDHVRAAIASAIQDAVSIPSTPASALARHLADVLTPVVGALSRAYAAKQLRDLALNMSWPDPRGMWRASDVIRERAAEMEMVI